MSLAPDLRRLARVVERIEDEGGEVEDVDVTVREQAGSLAEAMAALSGISNREVVFNLRVSADGVSGEELDETVHDSAEGVADEEPEPEAPTPDFQEQEEEESTTGPTTLGELSGLADLRREMEEEEEASGRAEAAEKAAHEAVEEEPEEATAEEEQSQAEAESATEPDGESGFPEHFPRVSRLENAGVEGIADLREVNDLEELSGIGPTYAEEIREALEEYDETGTVAP